MEPTSRSRFATSPTNSTVCASLPFAFRLLPLCRVVPSWRVMLMPVRVSTRLCRGAAHVRVRIPLHVRVDGDAGTDPAAGQPNRRGPLRRQVSCALHVLACVWACVGPAGTGMRLACVLAQTGSPTPVHRLRCPRVCSIGLWLGMLVTLVVLFGPKFLTIYQVIPQLDPDSRFVARAASDSAGSMHCRMWAARAASALATVSARARRNRCVLSFIATFANLIHLSFAVSRSWRCSLPLAAIRCVLLFLARVGPVSDTCVRFGSWRSRTTISTTIRRWLRTGPAPAMPTSSVRACHPPHVCFLFQCRRCCVDLITDSDLGAPSLDSSRAHPSGGGRGLSGLNTAGGGGADVASSPHHPLSPSA